MTEGPVHKTADIIPFPPRGQTGKAAPRRQTSDRLPNGIGFSCAGSGWYHDDAVQEEGRQHPPR